MRVTCPHCGPRDGREFAVTGSAVALSRPGDAEWSDAWHDYLHIRDNPAGPSDELWQHVPCGAWIVVTRNTVTHEIDKTVAAAEVPR